VWVSRNEATNPIGFTVRVFAYSSATGRTYHEIAPHLTMQIAPPAELPMYGER
jgi:hypothetical protein